ncbi:hypothetical protein DFS34DRAFT_698196, partial [Phlyctochytrium arcticum]
PSVTLVSLWPLHVERRATAQQRPSSGGSPRIITPKPAKEPSRFNVHTIPKISKHSLPPKDSLVQAKIRLTTL